MRLARFAACTVAACLLCGPLVISQVNGQSALSEPFASVPRLIRINGTVHDSAGSPLSGTVGITFTLYRDQNDPDSVWQEVQTVPLDASGHYSVLLGSMSEEGLPQQFFSGGDARWLGVRADGQAEEPRILLLSVAYALKAADSDMLGGLPVSAFALANSQQAGPQTSAAPRVFAATTGPLLVTPAASCAAITSDGTATVNHVAKFTTACNIENSAIFESSGNVGIGNTSPAAVLDVSGTAIIRGSLSALAGADMLPTGTATTSQAFISNPLDLTTSVYNTSLAGPANYVFRWQSEPTGNDTSNTGATLNLLYGVPGTLAESGLSVSKNGVINFSSAQTFPALGTVTSVATGTGLTGGPITKSGTISIPAGGVTNSLLANPSITVTAGTGLSGGGTVALGGTITLTNSAPSLGGTVTSVATGTGLTGGPITSTGTLSLNTSYTDGRYLQLAGGTLTGGLTGTTGTFSSTLSAAGSVLPSKGTATASAGFNSNPLDFQASSFSSSTSAAVAQDFRWQAEATGNDTASPSGSLHLLFGSAGATPAETGLSVASNGRITFASGQTFPGAGTITGVTAGSGLSGGGTSGSVSLSLLTTCATGQVLEWSGSAWACASVSSGGGGVSGTTDGIAYFSTPTGLTSTTAPANGQLLIGSTGNAPVLSTLTAGSNITITNGPGSITISSTGSGSSSPLPFFATADQRTASTVNAGMNAAILYGFLLPYSVTTTQVTYQITTADNTSNTYDIGIFNNSGTLVLDIGATAGTTFASSAVFFTLPWKQGSTTLAPGRYYVGLTGSCTASCAGIGAAPAIVSFAVDLAGGKTTGGALPASLTPPADVWNTGNQPMLVIR